MKEQTTDVRVTGGGTLYVFTQLTDQARDWVSENVQEGNWNPGYPDRVVVEHRYARDLAAGMQRAGLVVR